MYHTYVCTYMRGHVLFLANKRVGKWISWAVCQISFFVDIAQIFFSVNRHCHFRPWEYSLFFGKIWWSVKGRSDLEATKDIFDRSTKRSCVGRLATILHRVTWRTYYIIYEFLKLWPKGANLQCIYVYII